MYRTVWLADLYEVARFLNANKIAKDDIIKISEIVKVSGYLLLFWTDKVQEYKK